MDDRELLELAAKAAGIKHPGGEHCINGPAVWDCDALRWWRPLTDDGDALRLAVDLQMTIEARANDVAVSPRLGPLQVVGEAYINHKGSKSAATRRAIVRAAAEIGRAM